MKKYLLLSISLLTAGTLLSCGRGEVSNEPIYTTPTDAYIENYENIVDMTMSIGDEYDGQYEWMFYSYPLDANYYEVYECSFLLSETEIFMVTDFYTNDEATKSLMINLPNPERFTASRYHIGFFDKDISEELIFGDVNPLKYSKEINTITLEKGELNIDDKTLNDAKYTADDLLMYLLDSMNQYTSFSIKDLGFSSYLK